MADRTYFELPGDFCIKTWHFQLQACLPGQIARHFQASALLFLPFKKKKQYKKNNSQELPSHSCHLLPPPWLPPVVHHSHVIPPPGDLGGGRLSCWQCGAGVFISGGVLRCTMATLSLCQCQGCFAWLALSLCSRPAFVWAACQKFVTWSSSLKRHVGRD